MKRVLVTVPNVHWVHSEVAAVLLRLQQDPRYRLRVTFPSARPYENNLHRVVKDFLAEDFDYWLSIDADNPPQRNPLDLVALNLDLIGLPTPIWHYRGNPGERPLYWNAYRWDPASAAYREWMPREGLQQVDAIGTGCFVAARRIFEHAELQRGAFARHVDDEGCVQLGADLAFCERVRLAGFSVWCHFDYPCRHHQEIDLDQAARAIKGLTMEPV